MTLLHGIHGRHDDDDVTSYDRYDPHRSSKGAASTRTTYSTSSSLEVSTTRFGKNPDIAHVYEDEDDNESLRSNGVLAALRRKIKSSHSPVHTPDGPSRRSSASESTSGTIDEQIAEREARRDQKDNKKGQRNEDIFESLGRTSEVHRSLDDTGAVDWRVMLATCGSIL